MLGWSPQDLPLFLVMPPLLAASAFFSGSETALFGLQAHERAALAGRQDASSRATQWLLARPQALLITLLLGNMLVNVLYFVVSSVLLLRMDTTTVSVFAPIAASLVTLLIIILFGEVLPKLVASRGSLAWLRLGAPPLYALTQATRPLTLPLGRFVIAPLLRLVAPPDPPAPLDHDELERLLEIATEDGALGFDERELLEDVVDLGRRKVRDIMTPRVQMVAAEVAAAPEDIRERINSARTRYLPMYRENLDTIVGMLDVREYLLRRPEVIEKRLRPARFVPEHATLDHLLEHFREADMKVAIVVDEFGQTAGLVTAADAARSLIRVHHHDDGSGARAPMLVGLNRWEAPGAMTLHELEEHFDIRLDRETRVSTIAGLIMEELGDIGEPGQAIELGGWRISVLEKDGQRIERVLVEAKH
ncbi:MAG: hemolysin family protein [Phycisphaerales bacterium]